MRAMRAVWKSRSASASPAGGRCGALWTSGYAIRFRRAAPRAAIEHRRRALDVASNEGAARKKVRPLYAPSRGDLAFYAYLYARMCKSAPRVDDDALENVKLAMQKMLGARNHDDRQFLRPRPVEYRRDRHGLVGFPVDHERVLRHRRHVPAARRRADEHHPLNVLARVAQRVGDVRQHERAEREACEDERQIGLPRLRTHVVEHREQIVALAVAVVVLALRLPDAAKVRAVRRVVQLDERARERLRDLVVHRAAEERMRMRDE